MSPCKARAPSNMPESTEAESFVSVKIIVRPPLNQSHIREKINQDDLSTTL